jgi:hypothetical protein
MFHQKAISLLLIGSTFFYFTGCVHETEPVAKDGYYHSGIYFGKNLPNSYKQGIVDGCTTAKGVYKKSHKLFNNNQHYSDGWFLGRNKCNHLLVIEEDEKKVEN